MYQYMYVCVYKNNSKEMGIPFATNTHWASGFLFQGLTSSLTLVVTGRL